MKTLTCTCCGADISAPQFHNGKPYGYTCILKVAPEQKQVKTKFFPVEVLRQEERKYWNGEMVNDITFKFEGKKYRHTSVRKFQIVEQAGQVYISAHVFKDFK